MFSFENICCSFVLGLLFSALIFYRKPKPMTQVQMNKQRDANGWFMK